MWWPCASCSKLTCVNKIHNATCGDGVSSPYRLVLFADGTNPVNQVRPVSSIKYILTYWQGLPQLTNISVIHALTEPQCISYCVGYQAIPVPDTLDDKRRAIVRCIGSRALGGIGLWRSWTDCSEILSIYICISCSADFTPIYMRFFDKTLTLLGLLIVKKSGPHRAKRQHHFPQSLPISDQLLHCALSSYFN